MPKEPSTREQLAASRPHRLARQRLGRHEKYLHLLELARRLRFDIGLSTDKIDAAAKQAADELPPLAEAIGGKVYPRARPKKIETDETCTVFIDECGGHKLTVKESFKAFCVAAVIIKDSDFSSVDRRWKRWKRDYLGSSRKKVHEPDIRDRNNSFWCGGDRDKQDRAIRSLDTVISRLEFAAIACVVHRPDYVKHIGVGAWDESLPDHPYLMAVDFAIERLAMALYYQFNGARARVVLESREPAADARVQYEFSRLFLDGTSYVSSSWIRQQFLPGLEFKRKDANSTGLQLADLFARPCAEKALKPESTPDRWRAFCSKLCPDRRTANSIVGLKIVPWDDRYIDIWKS